MIGVAGAGPYAWDPHAFSWVVLVAAGGSVILGHRRLERSSEHPIPWTRRQMAAFGGAWLVAALALTWPLGTVAAHWSLTALVVQRVLLVLAVAPLLLLGLPYDLVQWLTRPRWVDALLLRLHRPPVAIPVVTVLVVGSMTPALVRAQATSPWARGLLDLAMVAAGLVLWIPVVGRIPGIPRLKPVVRFGYLVAQAVVPAFLSFIYIFSNHPLYPEFARSHAGHRHATAQRPADRRVRVQAVHAAGPAHRGGVVLSRAPLSDEEFTPDDPLVWADVERQFERVDRQGPRGRATRRLGKGIDHPADDPAPGGPGGDLTDHRHRRRLARGGGPRQRVSGDARRSGGRLRSMAG